MGVVTKAIGGYRFYLIGKSWYPSVTSIMSIVPSMILEKWKAKHTPTQVAAVAKYTAERGEMIHYGVLRSYETETVKQGNFDKQLLQYYPNCPNMKDEILVASRLFKDFKQKYRLSPVRLEQVVWNHEYEFAGRVDFAGYLIRPNGEKISILMDIKTSKSLYNTSLELQLAAYNLCINKRAKRLYCLLVHPGRTVISGVTVGLKTPHWKFVEIKPNYEGFLERLSLFNEVKDQILNGEFTRK